MKKRINTADFCKNFARIRKENNLTKREMAERIGISTAAVSMIESGTIPKRLSCTILHKMVVEFKVSISELLY